MLGRISQSQNLARRVEALVEEASRRLGSAPVVTVVTSDIGLRAMLDRRLRDRHCNVFSIRDAREFHAAIRDGALSADVLILDDALSSCSPFHGLAYARGRGVDVPAIALTRLEDVHARTEAERLDLVLCSRSVALGSLDRVLLIALRRRLAGRISRAA